MFSFLLLSACGNQYGSSSPPSPPSTAVVDESLQAFHSRFKEYSAIALGREIPMPLVNLGFADLGYTVEKGGMNGRCTTGPSILPTVEIDRLFWKVADDSRRENLMFHELGHCILGRSHVETTDQQGIPLSIMYPYTLSSNLYSARRTRYITELFQGSKHYVPQPSFADGDVMVISSFVDKEGNQESCSELTESRN